MWVVRGDDLFFITRLELLLVVLLLRVSLEGRGKHITAVVFTSIHCACIGNLFDCHGGCSIVECFKTFFQPTVGTSVSTFFAGRNVRMPVGDVSLGCITVRTWMTRAEPDKMPRGADAVLSCSLE